MARRRSGGEESLDSILDELRRSAGDPASMVLWSERALSHDRLRSNLPLLAAVQAIYARGLHDLDTGDRRENLERAVKALEEAVAGYERLRDDDGLSSALHELGLVYKDRIAGDQDQNLERSISCHSRAIPLAGTPEDGAMAAYELGRRYRARSIGDPTENTESAIVYLKRAATGYQAAGQTTRFADASSLLGLSYEKRGIGSSRENLEQAIAYHRAALDAYPDGSKKWVETAYDLGKAYSQRLAGDEAENEETALDLFLRARRGTDPGESPERWSNLNHALGVAYNSRRHGDRAENIELAIEYLTESLRYLDPRQSREDWQISHQTLAASYDYRLAGDRGANLDRAVELLTTALDVGGRSDNPRVWAMLQQSLALIYLKRSQTSSPNGDRREDSRRAREALENVLTVRTREADPAGWARATETLAQLDQAEPPAQLDQAETPAPAPQAAQGADARIDRLESKVAALRSTVHVYDREADPEGWARSRVLLEDALSEHAAAADPDRHWEERAILLQGALEVHTPDSNPGLCAGLALRLGNALAALGQWADAADAFGLAVEAAGSEYPDALTVLSRRRHLESTASAARLASYCLAKAGRLIDAAVMLERGRARALGDTLERDYGRLDELERDHPQLHRFYRDAAERLRRVQDAEHPSGDAGEVLTGLAGRMRAAREALDSAVRRIRRTPGYEDFLEPPTASLLLQAVRRDAPIAYLNTTPWGSLTLLLSRRTAVEVTPLWSSFTEAQMDNLLHRSGSADSIFPMMAGYLRLLYNLVESRFADGNSALTFGTLFNEPDAVHRAGREELGRLDILGRELISSLVVELAALRPSRLVLLPSATLALVPLHTIPYDDSGRCLIDDVAVSFAPSARVLRHARERAVLAGAGRPVLAGAGNPLPNPNPLWFARRELSEIAMHFDQATCLYGEDATKDRLLAAARTASHVHLACHGAVPFAGRQAPYLELAGGERITADDIARRRPFPAARMVVLSACQSALVGSFQLADEAMGLPTAVMLSGTPGVIGTLWAVNDLPTSLLMERFYSLLFGPLSLEPWDALRRAQRWLSELTAADVRSLFAADPELRHLAEENLSRTPGVRSILAALGDLDDPNYRPFADAFYWAPFVYVGE